MKNNEIIADRFRVLSVMSMRGSRQRFLCEDIENKNKVIVEALHETMLKDANALDDFRYQIDVSQQLNGPYFMGFLETLSHTNSLFLIWDYVDAQPLSRNSSIHEISNRDICVFISNAAKALSIADSKGINHGALSTDTILISPSLEPVIIGFVDPRHLNAIETDPGIIDGISSFSSASPEVKNGAKANLLSDLYSLGIIAKFLFSKAGTNKKNSRTQNSPEINLAKNAILGLSSGNIEQRKDCAAMVIDPLFIDSMATPPSGNPAVNLSKRQVRKAKRQQKKTRNQMNDTTRVLLLVFLKAFAVSAIAIGALLIVSKLVSSS